MKKRNGALVPDTATALINHRWCKRLLGIHEQRRIPAIAYQTLSRWYRQHEPPQLDEDQAKSCCSTISLPNTGNRRSALPRWSFWSGSA